jgi:hypothetical protein
MNKHYLDLDFTTATFYEYSKVAAEGFEEHTDTNNKVSFRKYSLKGVYGLLQSVSVKDTNYGKRLVVRVLNGDDVSIMNFPLYSTNGQVDNRYAEPLICTFPGMALEQPYRFYPYKLEKTFEGKTTPNIFYGVSVKHADLDKLEVGEAVAPKHKRTKKDATPLATDIPAVIFKEQFGSWKPTPASIGVKDVFLVNVLEEALVRLGYTDTGNKSATPNTTNPTAPTSNPALEPVKTTNTIPPLDDDDLPF